MKLALLQNSMKLALLKNSMKLALLQNSVKFACFFSVQVTQRRMCHGIKTTKPLSKTEKSNFYTKMTACVRWLSEISQHKTEENINALQLTRKEKYSAVVNFLLSVSVKIVKIFGCGKFHVWTMHASIVWGF
jgi:hypothetical protein